MKIHYETAILISVVIAIALLVYAIYYPPLLVLSFMYLFSFALFMSKEDDVKLTSKDQLGWSIIAGISGPVIVVATFMKFIASCFSKIKKLDK